MSEPTRGRVSRVFTYPSAAGLGDPAVPPSGSKLHGSRGAGDGTVSMCCTSVPLSRARLLIVALLLGLLPAGCREPIAPDPPMITSVSPASGPLAGGTAVTITGSRFGNVAGVTMGGLPLNTLVVVSPTQLTGTTPALAVAGAVDVVVLADGDRDTCRGCFTYNIPMMQEAPLAGGGSHSCRLDAIGVAYCWGANSNGQLGDGSTTSRATPAAVRARWVGFIAMAAGNGHTCLMNSSGTASCWGSNDAGQVGDGTTTERTAPVAVRGGLSFIALVAGYSHTCGLTGTGTAYCWGRNFYGQLGDGTTIWRTAPVAVSGGLNFVALAASATHTCGLTGSGTAYCWGGNFVGQLGDGMTTSRTTPGAVRGGLSFIALAAGYSHTCGLTGTGTAYCWGWNMDGQLGGGTGTNQVPPVAVSGGLSFVALAAGGYHTCGLTSGGMAYCWGRNASGQLGDGTASNRATPVTVSGGLSFVSLAMGGWHTCGLTGSRTAYCWGWNDSGQLGDGTTTDRRGGICFVVWFGGWCRCEVRPT